MRGAQQWQIKPAHGLGKDRPFKDEMRPGVCEGFVEGQLFVEVGVGVGDT